MEHVALSPGRVEDGAGTFFQTITQETGYQLAEDMQSSEKLPAPTYAEACLTLEQPPEALARPYVTAGRADHGKLLGLIGMKVIVQAPFRDVSGRVASMPVPGIVLPPDAAAAGLRVGYLSAPTDIYTTKEALQDALAAPLSPIQLPLLETMLAQHLPGVGEHRMNDMQAVPLADTGHAAAVASLAQPDRIHDTLHSFTAPQAAHGTGPSQLSTRIAQTGALTIHTGNGPRVVAQQILEADSIERIIIPRSFQDVSELQADLTLSPAELVVGMIAAAVSTRPSEAPRPDVRRNAAAMMESQ